MIILNTCSLKSPNLRNQYRTQARELMADRQPAESLYKTAPDLIREQIIQKQISKELSGDDIYKAITINEQIQKIAQ